MNIAWENIDKVIIFIAGSVTTIVFAFITPFANQWISRRFSRKPMFAIDPSRLSNSFKATVHPLNKLAQKRRNLNAQIGTINFSNVATIDKSTQNIRWDIDFSLPHIRGILMQSEKVDIKLFFESDMMSDSMELRRPIEDSDSGNRQIKQVDNEQKFLKSIKSDIKIYTLFKKGDISSLFPQVTDHLKWNNVLDGKELIVTNVSNIEISGVATLLIQRARYAWVILFKNCHHIILDNIVCGHEKE